MPDETGEVPARIFSTKLRGAWNAAGPYSLTEVETLSRKLERSRTRLYGVRVTTLPRSTLSDMLSGRRNRLPRRWQAVASLLAVLRHSAEEGGLNPDEAVGSIAGWKRTYDELKARESHADAAGSAAAALQVTAPPPAIALAGPVPPAGSAPVMGQAAGQEPGPEPAGVPLGSWPTAWWSGYRDVVPGWFETYLDNEPLARLIKVYEPCFVPGLLQTEAYARVVMHLGRPNESRERLDRRVALRLLRQRMLHERIARRQGGPVLLAIIDEGALHGQLGVGPAGAVRAVEQSIMREQVDHLLTLCSFRAISIQVRRRPCDAAHDFNLNGQGAADGPMALLRFPQPHVRDLVYLEQSTYALYPDKPKDLAHYTTLFGRLMIEAEPPVETVAILRSIRAEL